MTKGGISCTSNVNWAESEEDNAGVFMRCCKCEITYAQFHLRFSASSISNPSFESK